jgi:hypothetical protein
VRSRVASAARAPAARRRRPEFGSIQDLKTYDLRTLCFTTITVTSS